MVAFSGRANGETTSRGDLPVVDILTDLEADLGGRRQMRVTGNLNGAPFTASTMLVTGGALCVGVSKAVLTAANAAVGDEVQLSITATSSWIGPPEMTREHLRSAREFNKGAQTRVILSDMPYLAGRAAFDNPAALVAG
jgi:hypothetical protein